MENLINSPPPSSQCGFMELLGLHDLTPYYYASDTSPLHDDMFLLQYEQPRSYTSGKGMEMAMMRTMVSPYPAVEYSGDAAYHPATPNVSSISSALSEAAAGVNHGVQVKPEEEEEEKEEGGEKRFGETEEDGEEDEEQKTKKKTVKVSKKAKEKKQREPRFAFMTKSEVDHLEDGYRWRKYGQKAVKKSHFPRSYYRCTTASCNVKKRVERSQADPTIVMTTYEGQHIHPSPLLVPRHSALLRKPMEYSAFSGGPGGGIGVFSADPNAVHRSSHHHPCGPYYNAAVMRSGQSLMGSTSAAVLGKRRFCPPGTSPAAIGHHGLIEDVVPSHVLKEEQ